MPDITIVYRAVPNQNTVSGGWVPQISVCGSSPDIAVGRVQGGWEHRGMDKEQALQAAEHWAMEEYERYTGDWTIDVLWDRSER